MKKILITRRLLKECEEKAFAEEEEEEEEEGQELVVLPFL